MREIVLLADVRVFKKTGGDPIRNETKVQMMKGAYLPEGWKIKIGQPEIVVCNSVYKLGASILSDVLFDSFEGNDFFVLLEETGLPENHVIN